MKNPISKNQILKSLSVYTEGFVHGATEIWIKAMGVDGRVCLSDRVFRYSDESAQNKLVEHFSKLELIGHNIVSIIHRESHWWSQIEIVTNESTDHQTNIDCDVMDAILNSLEDFV